MHYKRKTILSIYPFVEKLMAYLWYILKNLLPFEVWMKYRMIWNESYCLCFQKVLRKKTLEKIIQFYQSFTKTSVDKSFLIHKCFWCMVSKFSEDYSRSWRYHIDLMIILLGTAFTRIYPTENWISPRL